MSRRLRIWLIFAAALVLILGAAVWFTAQLIRLDRENRERSAQAEREGTIRLALTQLESLVFPLIQQEMNRPNMDYRAFYPASLINGQPLIDCPTPLLPSPLQGSTPTFVNVHFTCGMALDDIASPQVPESNALWTSTSTIDGHRLNLLAVRESCACDTLAAVIHGPEADIWPEDIMRPVWINDLLILARRVAIDGIPEVQGAWLNWPELRGRLINEIADVLPAARLIPSTPENHLHDRSLLSLPITLEPGPVPLHLPQATSIHRPLFVTWSSLLFVMLASAILLHMMLRQDQRRSDFVTAVTHELRTPLTGLQMQSDLLASGLITDADAQQSTIHSIQGESRRLSHLVENVLAYAKVERGRGGRRLETQQLPELISTCLPRLQELAARCDLSIELDMRQPSTVLADPVAIEQILTNLVDNACKYAKPASQNTLQLVIDKHSVTLRDHGPGIPLNERKHLFDPFHKSARAAAGTAPGVGLGLALCRQLARQLEARIDYQEPNGPGASFVLHLQPA